MFAFGGVVADGEWHTTVGSGAKGDELREYFREFRGDHDESFPVGLGRGDVEQRDCLTGGGQCVGDE